MLPGRVPVPFAVPLLRVRVVALRRGLLVVRGGRGPVVPRPCRVVRGLRRVALVTAGGGVVLLLVVCGRWSPVATRTAAAAAAASEATLTSTLAAASEATAVVAAGRCRRQTHAFDHLRTHHGSLRRLRSWLVRGQRHRARGPSRARCLLLVLATSTPRSPPVVRVLVDDALVEGVPLLQAPGAAGGGRELRRAAVHLPLLPAHGALAAGHVRCAEQVHAGRPLDHEGGTRSARRRFTDLTRRGTDAVGTLVLLVLTDAALPAHLPPASLLEHHLLHPAEVPLRAAARRRRRRRVVAAATAAGLRRRRRLPTARLAARTDRVLRAAVHLAGSRHAGHQADQALLAVHAAQRVPAVHDATRPLDQLLELLLLLLVLKVAVCLPRRPRLVADHVLLRTRRRSKEQHGAAARTLQLCEVLIVTVVLHRHDLLHNLHLRLRLRIILHTRRALAGGCLRLRLRRRR
eukprot:Rhum_TRINITY_DN14077_c2_g2::Rhum_TRINITY_DN14077_c2_g2_i1::g.68583::m.68583